ncbi:MAG TPA: hypothetical protein PKM36_05830 [Propionibacteriaceae bacterium]|nr:hypothetical protein [Propionibacteriaceae bacterium]
MLLGSRYERSAPLNTHRAEDPFEYVGYDVDPDQNRVACHYRIGDDSFTEVFAFPEGGDWSSPIVSEATRLLYLLAGVSYYKTRAPRVIDVGSTPIRDEERSFLRTYYVSGLGEFAYRLRETQPEDFPDGLDLSDLELRGGVDAGAPLGPVDRARTRPLIPFGGGLDSIVSVAMLQGEVDDAALFIVNRIDDRYAAIEAPAALTGLPVVRAERSIDEKVLASKARGYLNGHVPVTGIISAMAVLAAALLDRDAVVMSNEWSASSATLVDARGHEVNHQFSKSLEFERSFVSLLRASGLPDYFSLLRSSTELWIADYFARHCGEYLTTFRSCNRSFAIDPARRLDHWCGVCDKCAFIDLILSPFVPATALAAVFPAVEPLQNPELLPEFERLLGLGDESKPWECVGDVTESRVALRMAADRPDRNTPFLAELVERSAPYADPEPADLLRAVGPHLIPERYARLVDLG